MAAFIQTKTKGQQKVFERMNAVLKTPAYSVDVMTKPTISTYYKSIKGTYGAERQVEPVVKGRTAVQNVIILRTQARQGRNAIYLSREEKRSLSRLIGDAIHAINKKMNHESLNKATNRVGKSLNKFYSGHIKNNRGAKGKFKANTRNTYFTKIYGQSKGPFDDSLRTELTPLIETGELMKSFTFAVKKIQRGSK